MQLSHPRSYTCQITHFAQNRHRTARWCVLLQRNLSTSLLAGAPACLLDGLQSVLNATARLICNRRKYDHITRLLRDVLHWLPVPFRIEYKLCLLVFHYHLMEPLQSTCAIAAPGFIPPRPGYSYDHWRGLISVCRGWGRNSAIVHSLPPVLDVETVYHLLSAWL